MTEHHCMINVFGGDYGFEVWRWRGGEARVRGVPKASASSRTIDIKEIIAP